MRGVPALVFIALAAAAAAPCGAQNPEAKRATGQLVLSGSATVSDGDTIIVSKVRIRLSGIDAPENGQRCNASGGGTWDCAQRATDELKGMIEGKDVRCEHVDTDTKSNRPVARCRVGDVDVQRELVRRGLVWAYREFENCYVADEVEARKRGEGIWQAHTMPPWEWR
jgi:endonuclease YncB( thermonuclease family)